MASNYFMDSFATGVDAGSKIRTGLDSRRNSEALQEFVNGLDEYENFDPNANMGTALGGAAITTPGEALTGAQLPGVARNPYETQYGAIPNGASVGGLSGTSAPSRNAIQGAKVTPSNLNAPGALPDAGPALRPGTVAPYPGPALQEGVGRNMRSSSSAASQVYDFIRQSEAQGLPAFQGLTAQAEGLGLGQAIPDPSMGGGMGGDMAAYGGGGAGVDPNYQVPSGPLEPNFIVQGLIDRGLPAHIAIGFAGNAAVESAFNPVAIGDGGAAHGLFQWNDRAPALKAFAQSAGRDWRDPEVQLDFVIHELRTTEGNAWKKISQSRTAEQAAQLISQYYERPGIPHLERRVAAARQIAQSLLG